MKPLLLTITLLSLLACSEVGIPERNAGGIEQLRADIKYLASDELEGRDTGTQGEALAAAYIIDRFEDIGLLPLGDNGSFYQTFDFTGSPVMPSSNVLSIGQEALADSLYYPLNFSGSAVIPRAPSVNIGYGIYAPELDHDDYLGKDVAAHVVTMSVSSPDGIHPHSDYLAYHDLRARANMAILRGATAVIFYNDDPTAQDPSATLTEHVETLSKPVLFVKQRPLNDAVVGMHFDIERPKLQGKNVIAFLDKGKAKNIVIGAHYDHLGRGISGSLHRGEPDVHNGADDNASGVAAMLQIALDLLDQPMEHNLIFIGFSGEERGLLGSNHFVKSPTVDLSSIAYMLNMDMVGRLDSDKNRLSINGVGTSPAWDFIDSTLVVSGLSPVTTESGTGPSDHMSFYLSDVPVLHFFSGTHSDYHKPSDDEEYINYPGIMSIVAYMERIIAQVDTLSEIPFTKTKGEDKQAASFKVTLGIVPDYLYEKRGMRIDGVTDDRPGAKAGLIKGDIIIAMGARPIGDIYAYMEGLAEHEAGETTTIQIIREGEEMELEVTFD